MEQGALGLCVIEAVDAGKIIIVRGWRSKSDGGLTAKTPFFSFVRSNVFYQCTLPTHNGHFPSFVSHSTSLSCLFVLFSFVFDLPPRKKETDSFNISAPSSTFHSPTQLASLAFTH